MRMCVYVCNSVHGIHDIKYLQVKKGPSKKVVSSYIYCVTGLLKIFCFSYNRLRILKNSIAAGII